jgi:microcystin-dependent protein
MSEPFLGQIMLVPYNFAPRGWAFCNGQILPISQNTALFSLLGTTDGGNGQTTFALPDLRGRVPISSGQGPGLSGYDLGGVGGQESVTLLINEIPAHNHMIGANDVEVTQGSVRTNQIPALGNYYGPTAHTTMAVNMVLPTPGGIGIVGRPRDGAGGRTVISVVEPDASSKPQCPLLAGGHRSQRSEHLARANRLPTGRWPIPGRASDPCSPPQPARPRASPRQLNAGWRPQNRRGGARDTSTGGPLSLGRTTSSEGSRQASRVVAPQQPRPHCGGARPRFEPELYALVCRRSGAGDRRGE